MKNNIEEKIKKILEEYVGDTYEVPILTEKLTTLLTPDVDIESNNSFGTKHDGKSPIGSEMTKAKPDVDVKKLRKKFEYKFEGANNDYDMETISSKQCNDIWNFFEPHLNSRNLLKKKLNYLNMRILKLKKGSKKYDYYSAQRFLIKELLDEFIESELNNE